MNKKQLLELASCCLWILAIGISSSISIFILIRMFRLAGGW